jgi:hypothetical protein
MKTRSQTKNIRKLIGKMVDINVNKLFYEADGSDYWNEDYDTIMCDEIEEYRGYNLEVRYCNDKFSQNWEIEVAAKIKDYDEWQFVLKKKVADNKWFRIYATHEILYEKVCVDMDELRNLLYFKNIDLNFDGGIYLDKKQIISDYKGICN